MRPLQRPVLCLVAGGRPASGMPLVDAIEAAVAGGVNLVQLREKDLTAGELLELATRVKRVCQDRATLFVNDRVDVALAAEVDGVQLGERSLTVAATRAIAGGRLLIGRSVHSVAGATAAAGADLLVLGTIYASASHPGGSPAGPGLIREVARDTPLPVLAIGGITPRNAGEAMAAGAAGVAVIGAILSADDPRKAAADLWKAVSKS